MNYDIGTLLTTPADLLGFGEPTHLEPAFAWTRNDLFAELAGRGYRSIALETDRVAALVVNDYVQHGVGTLDEAMAKGFSHGFGEPAANRGLVSWMREYNENRPPAEKLAFHGFDAATETMSAPSPRRALEFARDYLRIDLDPASLLGPDERWHRTEAVMDPAESPGATVEADRVRVLADDMLTELYTRAPELIAETSRAEWFRAETHLTSGLGLLRYHKQAAQQLEQEVRWTRMCATRDALMAQNLLAIRREEAGRGATLVFAHNAHLQRCASSMRMGDMDIEWSGAGAIVAALVGARYRLVLGSLGRDESIGLGEPAPDTYEGFLQTRVATQGLVAPGDIPAARTRADHVPAQGFFPLDRATIDAADAILHIHDGAGYRGSAGTGGGFGASDPVGRM
ncbi:erythromycin esterase family protein [Nocardia jinanensis]|uniref:Erythromycin esterase n=1 Tax=Nocardia jinanensis TaxID=382504 RepID=A0A917RRD2_9NOCA|nr:erythromycin esterase family protein [Nocardia jinanensis]GGL19382.1 erythromycin esterase [Nocardia jinanensis]